MSQSPSTSASSSAVLEYDKAWAALNLLIREGRGFSGHERKCCFLNLGPNAERFANVSSATGLDFDDDGRGLALCDWDWDGDLDLWITNRTGPGVRFIRNDTPSSNPAIAFNSKAPLQTATPSARGSNSFSAMTAPPNAFRLSARARDTSPSPPNGSTSASVMAFGRTTSW